MKNLKKKLKKTNKYYRFYFYTILVIFLISIVLISQGLLLLSGIESFIRYVLIFTFIVVLILYIVGNFVFLILKKHIWIIITGITAIIFSVINCLGFYYINKTYNFIDNINKDEITYTTNLISLKDTNKITKVGIISNEEDIEGYILPKEYIENKNKKYELIFYDDYINLINDLYTNDIDGLFITSNYILMYNNEFNTIKDDTKVIDSYSKKMKNQDLIEGTNKPVTEPFTALLIGVDSKYDGLAKNASFNGDALMLISFNPKTLSAVIFSIPRDTYVPIACNNNKENKINSAAGYGTKCMIDTIENLTKMDIDYYVKMNFKGVVDLVDALGGIYVDVPKPDFKSEYCLEDSNRIPRNVCLTEGPQVLDGEKALALARVRGAFRIVDFKRVQNQQLVLQAIVTKAKSIRNINDFHKVLKVVSKNLDTNIQTKEMLNFYNVGKSLLFKNNFSENEFINIQKTFLNCYDLTINGSSTVQYYEESLNEITKAMRVNLDLEKPKIIKTFTFSVNELYEEEIIGKKSYSTKRKETLPNFIGKSYEYLTQWNSTRNLNINTKTEISNICIDNEILNQSVKETFLISNINSLTVTICKNKVEEKYIQTTTTKSIIENNDEEINDIIENIIE